MNTIYLLGPEHSFSHIFAQKLFPDSESQFVLCATFDEIIHKTQKEQSSVGILPIENSTTSDVHENIDAIFRNKLQIIQEGYLAITLSLIGLKESSLNAITEVYSHPKALTQCSKYIMEHRLKTFEVSSTSAGKDILLRTKNIHAAIIGSKALVIEELKILEKNINNEQANTTRFVCVTAKTHVSHTAADNKATVIFTIPHIPGSLAQLLTALAKEDINLVKIQSRPIPGTAWEYQFLVDMEKSGLTISMLDTLLKEHTHSYTILGIYQKGELFES